MMFYKSNHIRKYSTMSFIKMFISYCHQRFRNLLFLKIILSIIIISLLLVLSLSFNEKYQLCDPAKPLWWFCSWPDPQTTVCSWKDHFPTISEGNRSPSDYEKILLSLPKVQFSFQFNNLTLRKCSEESIDLLIFVISKCSHASIRHSIRRTWGNLKVLKEYFPLLKIKLLFLVDIDSKLKEKIFLEFNYHEDLVQIENLPEQYEYVTNREAALYQFILERCQQTKFLFKTDDDIFINTFLLLFLLKQIQIELINNKYILFGFPIDYGLVIRHSNDYVGQRYVITKDEYSCPRYPRFLSGFGYLMSIKISSLFYYAYQTDIKPFPLSDVYFTGLISEMINIQRKTILQNVDYRYQTKCSEEFFSAKKNPLACAASNDHFNAKESNGDRSLMNDYNLYWTRLMEKYDSLKRINQK